MLNRDSAAKLNGSKNLKIAIQKEGRLTDKSLELLKNIGLEFETYKKRLFSRCRNFPLDILFVRDDDIPEYVQDGVVDLGIVGRNLLYENDFRGEFLADLGFGFCTLMLALPRFSRVKKVGDLQGLRIATTYPGSLRKFLRENKVKAEIVTIKGAVEITPSLSVADAICDIVSTGSTLKINELKPFKRVYDSEAVLVGNERVLKRPVLKRLMRRIQGVLKARQYKYIMMNAPANAVAKIQAVIPGLESPTVVPLAKPGMVAVHSVVEEPVFWEVIEKLKGVGASGILVLPIEKMIV